MNLIAAAIEALERGLVPDGWTRFAIRRLCGRRLRDIRRHSACSIDASESDFQESLRHGPVALVPDVANRQHYELPADFFAAILGPQLKYSCCYFPSAGMKLAEGEEAALALTAEHANLVDGQRILELGCGWGSLSLWMAQRFPNSQIVAVSNSATQQQFIRTRARELGVSNLQCVKCDMNDFSPNGTTFDRVVSVEMFEHMRNFELLLRRIASWLTEDGKLFVHIFCHHTYAYPFDTAGAANWMGRHFFTGGIMPSVDLFQLFQRDLRVCRQFEWSGNHYKLTAECWLANFDARIDEVYPILAKTYGPDQAGRWLNRWRMFFIAVAELFGFADGNEWHVAHYLFERAAKTYCSVQQSEMACIR